MTLSVAQAVPDVGGSAFVPAAPVWELVRRRQVQWGCSDDEMAAWLELGSVVDARAWMLRPTAERILRRLAAPRRGDATTALTAQLNATRLRACCKAVKGAPIQRREP